ncbi:MAG: hypothetical protein [Caudoviricetes sp.]|nr:MAG: hypothetical protein [Caudoviricetes sp.]
MKSENTILDSIITALKRKGEQTCAFLASYLQIEPAVMIGHLRTAVDQGQLQEKNGFYFIAMAKHNSQFRGGCKGHVKKMLQALETKDMSAQELTTLCGLEESSSVSSMLRNHIKSGAIVRLSTGMYHFEQRNECPFRMAHKWVEGRIIPRWVQVLASGIKGCESVYVVAELDEDFQKTNGYPRFVLAYLDIRMNQCICGNTGVNISGSIVRYLPFDTTEAAHA